MLLLQPAPIIETETTRDVRSVQKRLRAQIANAIRCSTDHRLSPSAQAAAVEAELLVQGFDARVLPVDGIVQQDQPVAG